uniref:STXB5 n=1 Tax=Macrostomum lignano TaxID=282301 RepID=A0A1I8GGG7_9PLAT
RQRVGNETFVAKLNPLLPVQPLVNTRRCKWILTCAGLSEFPLQLVLLGSSEGLMRYEYNGKQYDVLPGTIHAMDVLDESCIIKVSASVSSQHPPDPPSLRVVLLQPTTCARGFLYYQGGCYTASGSRQSFKDFSSSILGSAQLASFSSMAEISSFITASR